MPNSFLKRVDRCFPDALVELFAGESDGYDVYLLSCC